MKIYLWLTVLILIFIVIIATALLVQNHKKIKRKNDLLRVFNTACKKKGITDYKLEYVKKDTHDVYFESENHIYYVKVVYNPANHEICINNAIKWQIRKLGETDDRNLMFASGIEPLMRLDLRNKKKKEHKLFIIYPNTRALLKIINECEMVFVYPDTDVYGARVMTYYELDSNPELLEV